MKNKISFLQLIVVGIVVMFFLLSVIFSLIVFHGHPVILWKNTVYVALLMVYLIELLLIHGGITSFKLLNNIKKQKLKTVDSLSKMTKISRDSLFVTIFSFGFIPMFYNLTQASDAPGVMVIGMCIFFIALSVYAGLSVLEGLLRDSVSSQKA